MIRGTTHQVTDSIQKLYKTVKTFGRVAGIVPAENPKLEIYMSFSKRLFAEGKAVGVLINLPVGGMDMGMVRARAIGCFCIVSALGCLTVRTYGQAPRAPSFEVASVKRNVASGSRVRFETPPGKLTATNTPLRFLIRQAYRVPEARILGGPAWIDTERFDILANAPAGTATTSDGIRAMLRTLLTERFGLVLHSENREMPVY